MVRAELVPHRLSVMPDGAHVDAAVVVLVADAAASAGVVLVADDEAVAVVIEEMVAVDGFSARGLFAREGDLCANHQLLSCRVFRGGLSQATGRRRAGRVGRGAHVPRRLVRAAPRPCPVGYVALFLRV